MSEQLKKPSKAACNCWFKQEVKAKAKALAYAQGLSLSQWLERILEERIAKAEKKPRTS